MNALKTLFYMGAMHGFFTIYLPVHLASLTRSFDTGIFQNLAYLFWVAGVLIIIRCSVDIIHRGRGTPAHLDPPRELVIAGIYRHVRNPIYLGALIVQVGYVVWFGSTLAIIYTFSFFLAFHFLIIVIEEPALQKQFGAAYEEYCGKVSRWVPRLK